jgi:hypothetical protein
MLSEHIQRFILTSIDSIPHLEAILLLRYNQTKVWDAKMIAETLYIQEKKACEVLKDLNASKFIVKSDVNSYYYQPISEELKNNIDQLADIYSKNLIEVTNLIHSKTSKQAQQFGDAFKWLNEKDK